MKKVSEMTIVELMEEYQDARFDSEALWKDREQAQQIASGCLAEAKRRDELNAAQSYRANFLYPPNEGSVDEAGYEFANGATEEYRLMWWKKLLARAMKLSASALEEVRKLNL